MSDPTRYWNGHRWVPLREGDYERMCAADAALDAAEETPRDLEREALEHAAEERDRKDDEAEAARYDD